MDATDGVWMDGMDGVGIVMINSFLLAVLDDLHLLLVTLVKLAGLRVDLQIQIQIQIKHSLSSPVSELTFFFSRVRDSSLILLMKLIRSSLIKQEMK